MDDQCQDKNEGSDKTLPLHLISPKSHAFLNSQYANEAHKLHKQEQKFVLISPADADVRQISEGDEVRIFNQHGKVGANARVTPDMYPDGGVFGSRRATAIKIFDDFGMDFDAVSNGA